MIHICNLLRQRYTFILLLTVVNDRGWKAVGLNSSRAYTLARHLTPGDSWEMDHVVKIYCCLDKTTSAKCITLIILSSFVDV